MVLSTFSGVQMPPKDIQIVADFYSTRGVADYNAFVRDIEEADRSLPSPSRSSPRATVNVSTILANLKTSFSDRRISPRGLFPQNGNGRISKYAFEKIIRQTEGTLTPAEVTAISAAFPAGPSEVDYDAFVEVFEEPLPSDDVSGLVGQISATLESRRLPLRPVIARFDRYSADEVGRSQLITALQNCSVVLGAVDVDRLIRAFPGRERGSACVSALCDAVDPLLQDPPPEPAPTPVREPESRPPPTSPVLDRIVRVGKLAQGLRIDFETEFRRIDRLRHGYVSEAQWRTVMALFKGRVPESELRAIYAEYQRPDGFDYRSFVRDCSASPAQEATVESPEFVDALRKCKAFLVSKMTTMDVLFRRYDPLGTGLAPTAVICKAFADYGMMLNQAEVSAIGDGFRDPRAPEKFSYVELERRLENVVVKREEHVPTLYEGWVTEEYKRTLSSVKTELREKLHARPRAFRRLLATVRQGAVTEREFLQALEDSGVVLLKEQKEALLNGYRIPGSGNIDFTRFSYEIENTVLVGSKGTV
jgi:Ca2+-binding EF-hand superfamily protein